MQIYYDHYRDYCLLFSYSMECTVWNVVSYIVGVDVMVCDLFDTRIVANNQL